MTASTARLDQREARWYWGWNVVAVSVLAMGVSGSPSYAYGFFLKPVAEEFGASRAAASLDRTHDYTAALVTFLGALVAAACAVLLLRPSHAHPEVVSLR